LLLDVAVFAASVSLNGVSEAFGVHEINNHVMSHIQQVDIAPVTVPDATQAAAHLALAPVDPTLLPQLGGRNLLNQLALLPRGEVASFVDENPSTISNLLINPLTARQMSALWAGWTPEKQAELINSMPEVIGNLGGVPFDVRDRANRQYLGSTIADLQAQLDAGLGRAERAEVRDHLRTLRQIERALEGSASHPRRTLVTVDTTYPGRAAIVDGDLRTADYVSYLIPGMFFTIGGQVGDWADTASQLRDDQMRWLHYFGQNNPVLAGKTVATVAWIGYETPHLLNVGSLDLADQGANYLTQAIEGLQQVRAENPPYISVLAHSYGSTAALIALQQGAFQIDALAVVGSPGSTAQSVGDLAVRDGNVYVGEANWDPVVNTAFYGSDPGADSYGAYRMSVDGGTDPITNETLGASFGHNGYFDPGSESMRNMALIGIDMGQFVTDGSSSAPTQMLAAR
jgi:hypothetical protein